MKSLSVLLILLSSQASAQDFSAIEQLGKCSDPKELSKLTHTLALAAGGNTDAVKQYDTAHAAAQRCSEDSFQPALAESSKSPDLKSAVKELYVKGNALIAKAGQAADPALERERNDAWERVRMEIKLVK